MSKDKKVKPEDLPKPTATPAADAMPSLQDLMPPLFTEETAQQDVIEDTFHSTYDTALRFGFVGCGQGGGRLAQEFFKLGYRRVAVINTTSQDFAGIDESIPRLDLAISGAFKSPSVAAKEIASREEEIWSLLHGSMGSQVDSILVCAGLGGGTGTGLSPYVLKVVSEYLQKLGSTGLAGGIFALPMKSEGRTIMVNAANGLSEILKVGASPVFLLDNSRLFELQNRPAMSQMFVRSNAMIAQMLHQFNRLAAQRSSFITFDRSEFIDVLRQGIVMPGMCNLKTSMLAKPGDLLMAMSSMLSNNMLCQLPLSSASRAAGIFLVSPEALDKYSIDHFGPSFEKLERMLSQEEGSVVHRGIYPVEGTGLGFFVLVSGLKPPSDLLQDISAGKVSRTKAQFFGID